MLIRARGALEASPVAKAAGNLTAPGYSVRSLAGLSIDPLAGDQLEFNHRNRAPMVNESGTAPPEGSLARAAMLSHGFSNNPCTHPENPTGSIARA